MRAIKLAGALLAPASRRRRTCTASPLPTCWALQMRASYGDRMEFIHQEDYEHNNPNTTFAARFGP